MTKVSTARIASQHQISSLPSLDEVPSRTRGQYQDGDAILRLSLIPRDDVELRSGAVKLINAERNGDMAKASQSSVEILNNLADVPAKTPGGISWKLAQILCFFQGESDWKWWRYLLESAQVDAMELERHRSVSLGSDPDAELKRLRKVWREIEDNPETEDPNDPTSDITREWVDRDIAAEIAVCAEPAYTLEGLSIKLQLIARGVTEGWNSNRMGPAISTALDAAERLAPGSVIYRPSVPASNLPGEEE